MIFFQPDAFQDDNCLKLASAASEAFGSEGHERVQRLQRELNESMEALRSLLRQAKGEGKGRRSWGASSQEEAMRVSRAEAEAEANARAARAEAEAARWFFWRGDFFSVNKLYAYGLIVERGTISIEPQIFFFVAGERHGKRRMPAGRPRRPR